MSIAIQDLGFRNYKATWDFQKHLQGEVIAGNSDDTLLLVEHDPVYTLGKNADDDHLLQNVPKDVKVFHVERGGDIAFHGPGQLVGYPILDLHRYRKSVHWYMRSLEQVIIQTLDIFDIEADVKEGLTGVWVGDEKIAALGVRISRWVTMHGFALNVNPDLTFYDGIIPCGIFDHGVTSMEKILGKKQNMNDVKKTVIEKFTFQFKNKNEKV